VGLGTALVANVKRVEWGNALKIGIVQIFDGTTGRGIEHICEFAEQVEQLSFDSLWVPDHVIFFDSFSSKYPHTPDGTIDFKKDQGILEPAMCLLAAGQVTSRIRLGTSVEILTERNPVIRARELMTLDIATNGRVEYGVGIGWSEEEYAALGIPFADRGRRADEYIQAMRVLWSDERPSYHGKYVNFDNVVFEPKPLNRRIPIVIGGNSQAAISRVVRLGDGWHGWNLPVTELEVILEDIHTKLKEVSRDRASVKLNVGIPFKGSLQDLKDYADHCKSLGVDELIIAMGFSRTRFHDQLAEVATVLGL